MKRMPVVPCAVRCYAVPRPTPASRCRVQARYRARAKTLKTKEKKRPADPSSGVLQNNIV